MHKSAFWSMLVLASIAPGSTRAQPVQWKTRIATVVRDTTLANGLTVIVAENHSVPIITVKVAFRGGAGLQTPGEEGLAHLAEHYLFRTYGEDAAFAGEVANMNGTYNGTTSEEEVNYFMTVPSKQLASAVRVMARLVREPRMNDRAFAAEKKIVIDELARDGADGNSVLRQELGSQLWGDAWPRRNVSGTPKGINSLKFDRVRSLLATQYSPGNAALVITGDVDPTAALAEAVRRFSDWPAGSPAVPDLARKTPAGTRTFVTTAPDVRLIRTDIAWVGPGATEKPRDAIAGELFAEMLNAATSPVKRRLVSEGIAQSFEASAEVKRGGGPFRISITTTGNLAERTLRALREEINQFGSASYLSESLLSTARKQLMRSAEYQLESGMVMAGSLSYIWATGGLDYFRTYGDAVETATLADVERFVKTYLIDQPFVAGALAPSSQVTPLRGQLSAIFGGR